MENNKSFELGVYTFGNTPRTESGSYGTTAQAIRNALEAVKLAEEVGLNYFGLVSITLDQCLFHHLHRW